MANQTNMSASIVQPVDQTFATQDFDPESSEVSHTPINVATISSGFEKGDFLVREEKAQRVYFDFFEEAFNYLANKGYARMKSDDADEWMEAVNAAHSSIPNGTRYNTGVLLMVLQRPVDISTIFQNRNNPSGGMDKSGDADSALV